MGSSGGTQTSAHTFTTLRATVQDSDYPEGVKVMESKKMGATSLETCERTEAHN